MWKRTRACASPRASSVAMGLPAMRRAGSRHTLNAAERIHAAATTWHRCCFNPHSPQGVRR
ncbi:MAG: hypothetical protein OJF61_001152 [Rhodanobacteraceae bacterium]|nr:MAG: hypothetical protein OJF61_001152 [Rhodanobacteraceae bacterium]